MSLATLAGWLRPQRLLHLAFGVRPADEFLVCGSERLTRRQVYASLRALAGGLQALGVEPGERIATLLPACPEAVYALFLPPLLGTVHVPLNPLLGEHELRHILADCGSAHRGRGAPAPAAGEPRNK